MDHRLIFTEANVTIVLHEVANYLSTQNSPGAERLAIVVNTLLQEAYKNVANKAMVEEYQSSKIAHSPCVR